MDLEYQPNKFDIVNKDEYGRVNRKTYFLNDKYIKYINGSTISLIQNDETSKLSEEMFYDEKHVTERYYIRNVSNVRYLMSPTGTVETPQVVTQSVSTFKIENQLELLNESFSYRGNMGTHLVGIYQQLQKLNKLLKKHFN